MSWIKELEQKKEAEVKFEVEEVMEGLDEISPTTEPLDLEPVKPKRSLTLHKDKKFTVDRDYDKNELFSKIVEIYMVHEKEIPAEFIRSLYINIDLMAHRKLLKK